jgi:hypothetical protein
MIEAERRKRLTEWLDVIYKDVQDVVVDDHVFWEIQEIFRQNSRLAKTPSIFNQWMASAFIQSAALGVRRQADKADTCVSLHRLLLEVKKYPGLVSREYYVSLCANLPEHHAKKMADGTYDRLVGAGLVQPDPEQVQAEIDELLAKTDGIRHYVDRRAAHYDTRGIQKPIPTFNDLADCLAFFERLIKKYKDLLTGVALSNLLPVFLYDWKAIFHFPWLERPAPPRILDSGASTARPADSANR